MTEPRDEFTQATKDLLAKRAGYTCSYPDCGRRTIGAASDPNKAVNVGVAAHICAAAKNGPRYDAQQTPKQRRSHKNGIWLCSLHAGLIDRDVDRFPVALLHQWKAEAEQRSQREVGDKQPLGPQAPVDELPERGDLPPSARLDHRPNPAFVGRHQDLLNLHQRLNQQNKAVITPLAAATGMGGIGKTQLAIEYAYRYGRFYPGGVFWLEFGDPDQVPSEFVSCGVKMGLFEPNDPTPQDAKLERVQQSWSQGAKKRLLIFDNCESEELLDRWAPRSGPNQVLVTSRNQHWSPALGLQQCPLGLLARAESIELLQKQHPALSEEQANAIATELGDLPLALYLAGSYLAYYGDDPLDYLAELPKQPMQHPSLTTSRHRTQPTKHDTHVGRTFARSFARLDPQDPTDALATTLLLHAAQFAPGEAMDQQHLLATVAADAHASKEALVRLLELGLIQRQDTSLTLHRLLQHFCQEAYPAEQQNQAETHVATVIYDLADEVNEAGLPNRMAPLLAHLRYQSERLFPQDSALTVDLTVALGNHLKEVSAWPEAERYYRRALTVAERVHAPDHVTTAVCLNNLAALLQATHRLSEAEPLIRRALSIDEAAFGPDHPNVATRLNNLAQLLQDTHRLSEAEPLMRRALSIDEAASGPDHPNVAIRLSNLAQLLQATHRLSEAEPLMRRALSIDEAASGLHHPKVAIRLNNLAQLLKATERLSEAEPLMRRALSIGEAAFGPHHPMVAIKLGNLAQLLFASDRAAEAEPLSLRSLVLFLRSFSSPDHPYIQTARSIFVKIATALGRSEEDIGRMIQTALAEPPTPEPAP